MLGLALPQRCSFDSERSCACTLVRFTHLCHHLELCFLLHSVLRDLPAPVKGILCEILAKVQPLPSCGPIACTATSFTVGAASLIAQELEQQRQEQLRRDALAAAAQPPPTQQQQQLQQQAIVDVLQQLMQRLMAQGHRPDRAHEGASNACTWGVVVAVVNAVWLCEGQIDSRSLEFAE